MERRIGVIGIVVEDRKKVAPRLNEILSQHGEIIIGRMGVPYRKQNISVLAILIDGTTDEVGSLAGKLGNLDGIYLKSALTAKEIEA